MKLLKLADRTVSVIGLILFGALTLVSVFQTEYFAITYEEIPTTSWDIFPLVVIFCAAAVWLMNKACALILREEDRRERNIRILLAAVMTLVCAFCIYWVFAAKVLPLGDQDSVSGAASDFLAGDYSLLTLDSYSRYLYIHPHQLGLTALLELVYAIFGSGNYLAFELLNCIGASAVLYSGYRIVRLLSPDSPRAVVYYLFTALMCFPLFFYVTFVYGEVPSIVFQTAAIWFFLESVKKKRIPYFILCCVCTALACLIRNNSLILLTAFALILLVRACGMRKIKPVIGAALIVLCFFGSRFCLCSYYEAVSGEEINEGAPMILYVAMGMQKDEGAAGWSNGYILHNYWGEADFDYDLSVSIAKEDISASLAAFADDPAYALKFYAEKFVSQWNDPTYECFEMTHTNGSARGPVANSMYYGKLHTLMTGFMNGYQSLIYLGVFLCLLLRFRRDRGLEDHVIAVAVIGGFLFSMLWEAKGRYILPYFVMMLPLAATGLSDIAGRLTGDRP